MRLTTLVFYLIIMLSTVANAQTIPVHKTNKQIIIDGNLSDWNEPFLGPFVIHNSGEKALQNTFVSLSWNDENLFLAYKCNDSQIIGTSQKRDSQIYNTDDLVEIFLDPDGDSQNYIEIGVNAFSTNYDLLLKCISPECGGWNTSMDFDIKGLESVSKITSEGYIVEIKIPFSSLEKIKNGGFIKPKIGTKWKGNAFRIDYGNTTEYLALQPYKSSKFGFHQPEEFAVFEFVD
ncbi:carbohydrate-binding family 9-like protein [Flavobacterium sp. KACC 22763]|uniref:carbohydrate-binding family 9-like protein n=1 Tax=Flavobacterium sp. KACC 22763 TaxID=3025668 RepID=UPI0023657081|nr:carbohydrate-binding family 9-like protein [Flavobacterium sp. KACC 22763]WDF65637.1 carbohydrate-binding family 9-like protein [Flavobacterium sp. KACC 22763]